MASKDTGGQKRASQDLRGGRGDRGRRRRRDVAERKEKLDDDIDAILDEIDEVLEENTEDFVRGFVQEGRAVARMSVMPMTGRSPPRGGVPGRRRVATDRRHGRLPAAFLTPGSSSFAEFLGAHAPELLPGRRTPPATALTTEAPHGTTIVALTFPGGVVMAGDRRATMGNYIAQRDIEKVFHADDYSCVGIAGTAGIAIEMVRLFQVELEHYEKIEGTTLSLEGKANRLALMIRGNLAMAMQGLAVVPLFAGYDLDADDATEAGALLLRRHRRPLRGAQVPLGRLRLAVRPRRAEEALARRPLRRGRHPLRRPVALRRGRRGLRHRRARPHPADLPGRRPRSPPTATGGSPTTRSARSSTP